MLTCQPFLAGPRRLARANKDRRARQRVCGVLDSSQTIAVSQQLAAYAVLVAGEGAWAMNRVAADVPGRPSTIPTVVASAGSVAAVTLLQFQSTQLVAEVVGLLWSTGLLYYFGRRVADTPGSSSEWPGPKAPPVGMTLVTFFVWNIFLQSLRV